MTRSWIEDLSSCHVPRTPIPTMNHQARKTLTVLALLASAWPLMAQTSAPVPAKPAEDKDVVILSPFEVTATQENGYQATETLAGTRIRTDLRDVSSAISVITKEFLRDVGATDSSTLLQYTTNAEVGGTRGTYAGLGNGTSLDDTASLRSPAGAQRVRGLAAADNTRDFFVTDIPWDSYNVDRIDIQRGPNSILFGLGSPAGIVNASLHNADFRNHGELQNRIGSYGSFRTSLDVNQEIIHNVLAVRVDGLWNDERYQQKPAYQNDRRISGALRFDPQLFKDRSFHTSLKIKYENGDIKANRPRVVPPNDSITPWFRPVDATKTSLFGGMNKKTVTDVYAVGSNTTGFAPWLVSGSLVNRQQPIYFIDGANNDLLNLYGGYVNTGARSNTGANLGPASALIGQRDSSTFFGVGALNDYANAVKLPGYQYGQYRAMSLTDPTVFDFYNHLIDGPNKSEFEKWDAYNIDLSQTAWDDRVGVQLSYDHQKYKRGGQALLGNRTINIDVMQNFQDLSANTNYGRAFVVAGPGSGDSYKSDRKYVRGSLFGEVRSKDFLHSDFLVKLIGRHRFNGVYSKEDYQTENRSWQMYANSQAWAGYWNGNNGANSQFTDRPPVGIVYLGSTLGGATTAAGAKIPGITAPITLNNGKIYAFDSTWTAPSTVAYNAPWTVPPSLSTVFGAAATTQASNPANYIGWNKNFQLDLLRYDNGADPSLLTKSLKYLRVTKSYAGTWQGYMWNDAIVPTLGWRFDEVKSKGATARGNTATNRGILDFQSTDPLKSYQFPDNYDPQPKNSNKTTSVFKDHSTAGGIVVHVNKLFGEKDPLPFNVSFSYNKSNNFQVTDARVDVYGNSIANPKGATKEYGVLLSTKDGKYSFRAVKFENSLINGSANIDPALFGETIRQGLKWRNVFLYRMNGYTWDTREQTDLSSGKRYWWQPAWVDSSGKVLGGGSGAAPTGSDHLQTQAEANAQGDAVITAWNNIQKHFTDLGYFNAWGYTPQPVSVLTDRSTYQAALGAGVADPTATPANRVIPTTAPQFLPPDLSRVYSYAYTVPQGFAVTSDSVSKGYEFELTANPTPNWRVSFNAAKTEAVNSNVGGPAISDLMDYMDTQMAGAAGQMRQFNGDYSAGNALLTTWNNRRGQYTLLKLQEGAATSELRKWRYNVITNYSFTQGKLKGFGVGGGYRWQDKVTIGYPVVPVNATLGSFDLSKPYFGPTEAAVDLWTSYERKLTDKINWKIQLNVRNAFAKNGFVPISVEPDGKTVAAVRTKPVQEWFLTNTFSF